MEFLGIVRMIGLSIRFLLLLPLFCVACALQGTEKVPTRLEALDQIVENNLKRFHVPGAAIGIVVDNKILFMRGYGTRNQQRELPVTTNTRFQIASCTKAFTAAVLFQLVQEGKISWDDPVIRYLPDFRMHTEILTNQVTIRDLIAHRTGLYRHDALCYMLEVSRPDLLKRLPYLEPAAFLRERFEYNNIMYAVAAMVVERATGQSWEEAVQKRLLKPLGMSNSGVSIQELYQNPDYSLPYSTLEGEVQAIPFFTSPVFWPGGGINSSVADMTKWVQEHLSKEAFQEMHTIQMPIAPPTNPDELFFAKGYGLGWYVGSYRGHAWVNHSGLIDGFSSHVTLLPEKKIGLVILTNSSSDGPLFITAIRNTILDAFLEAYDIDWPQKVHETRLAAFPKQALTMSLSSPARPLTAYVGSYSHPAYGTAQVVCVGQNLLFTYGKEIIVLKPQGEDVFQGKLSQLEIFGVYPFIDFTFASDAQELHVPFEAFRGAKPIIFRKNP